MQLIRGNDFDSYFDKLSDIYTHGCALSIGNFDGIHKGHDSIINKLKIIAKQNNLKTGVMLFDPSPKLYFALSRGESISRNLVLPLRDKLKILKDSGVDFVFLMRFNHSLSVLSAENFVNNYLIKKLNVKSLVVGEDFRFGYKGSGNYKLLDAYSKKGFFSVHKSITKNYTQINLNSNKHMNYKISSTQLRKYIKYGDFSSLHKLLGREYKLSGRVQHGNQLGRTIGFPTINIKMPNNIALAGVFCVKVLINDSWMSGVANIGFRPTLSSNLSNSYKNEYKKRCLLEVHLFDYNQSIYGINVEVVFYHKLREEQKFGSIDALKQQLSKDEKAARKYFIFQKDKDFVK